MTKESKRRYLAREGLSRTESRPQEKTVEVPFRALPLKKDLFFCSAGLSDSLASRRVRCSAVIRIGYMLYPIMKRAGYLYIKPANLGGNAEA